MVFNCSIGRLKIFQVSKQRTLWHDQNATGATRPRSAGVGGETHRGRLKEGSPFSSFQSDMWSPGSHVYQPPAAERSALEKRMNKGIEPMKTSGQSTGIQWWEWGQHFSEVKGLSPHHWFRSQRRDRLRLAGYSGVCLLCSVWGVVSRLSPDAQKKERIRPRGSHLPGDDIRCWDNAWHRHGCLAPLLLWTF